jgi:transcriptional regulator with XRE-family HTH domain
MKIIREQIARLPAQALAERIKAARKADGRSVQVLATLCGISDSYWYQLEGGVRYSVKEVVIRKMEEVMGVDLQLPPFEDEDDSKGMKIK